MAAENPPQFWDMVSAGGNPVGVWNVDAQADFDIHVAGDASLRFNGTLGAIGIRSGVFPVDAAGRQMRITIQARQSKVQAGLNKVRMLLLQLDKNKKVIVTNTLFDAELPFANRFFRIGKVFKTRVADRFFRLQLEKFAFDPTVEVHWDALEVKTLGPSTKRFLDGGGIFAIGSSTTNINPQGVIWCDAFVSTGVGGGPGICSDDQIRVNGQVKVNDVAVNRFIQAGIEVTTGGITTSHLGPKAFAHMSSQDLIAQTQYTGQVDADTEIKLQVFLDDPVTRNIDFSITGEDAPTWIAAETVA